MNIVKHMRFRGMLTLIVSAVCIVLLLGGNYYMGILQDEEEARVLVERELRLVDKGIMWELYDVKAAASHLADAAQRQLAEPDSMFALTREVLERNDFVKAAGIGFVPDYYAEKGHWFEPRSIRYGNKIVKEQGGGAENDYFGKSWYRDMMADKWHRPRWSAPYVDHSQRDEPLVMTITCPLRDSENRVVAVIGIDVSLLSLRRLLKSTEPYPGSICQLLDGEGRLLVSSADIDYDSSRYYIGEGPLSAQHLQVRLACPQSAIYGSTTMKHLLALCLLLLGLLLLAYIVQHSIRNMLHLDEARQQQRDMEREMNIAHDIQMHMLRHDFPKELSAVLQPMKEVGGDLYDFCQRGDALFFIVGDVSGKGLPAAMMMAGVVVLFRMAARHFDTPSEIVNEINHILSERNTDLMFVTAFVGKIDMQRGLLTFCNAGHNPPVLNGGLLSADPDIPIGYDAQYVFRQNGAMFPEGSRLVLYTDGITEARDAEHKLMGKSRFLDIVRQHEDEGVDDMTAHIVAATHCYSNDAEQGDDMTLMCISNTTPAKYPSLVISNEVEELGRVKPLLREYCVCMGCDRRLMRNILLAVEEAVVNVISYAYQKGEMGQIEIDIHAEPSADGQRRGSITVVISDRGMPFDPLARTGIDVEKAVEDRQTGGLGIYLYQQLMDSVFYQRTGDGRNVLTLTKEIIIHNS